MSDRYRSTISGETAVASVTVGTSKRSPKLPLDDVSYPLLDTVELQSGPWPPARFRARDAQLDIIARASRGDWSGVTDETIPVLVNYLGRVVVATADLLMASPPELPGADEPMQRELNVAAYDILANMVRYGMGLALGVNTDAGQITSVDPREWYPALDGEVIARRYPADPDAPDADNSEGTLEVVVIQEGAMRFEAWDIAGDELGARTEQAPGDDAALAVIPRAPDVDGWGTSALPEIMPAALELDRRFSLNSVALDKHSKPGLGYEISDSDLEAVAASWNTTITEQEWSTRSPLERLEIQREYLTMQRERDVFAVDKPVRGLRYLSWDSEMPGSFSQIDALKKELDLQTSILTLLDQHRDWPSGIAIQQVMIPLYARTLSLLERARFGMQTALGAVYASPQLEWGHTFDTILRTPDEAPTGGEPPGEESPDAPR